LLDVASIGVCGADAFPACCRGRAGEHVTNDPLPVGGPSGVKREGPGEQSGQRDLVKPAARSEANAPTSYQGSSLDAHAFAFRQLVRIRLPLTAVRGGRHSVGYSPSYLTSLGHIALASPGDPDSGPCPWRISKDTSPSWVR
jgi:hypothetical protein